MSKLQARRYVHMMDNLKWIKWLLVGIVIELAAIAAVVLEHVPS